ncbi:hypothetical protein CCMSSC00406_0006621 [Pleurotus cornucopiae]|uniref:Uncharacterized protein n=1 Tax=Pleurotus cornucopiae TaxID=5321 RepID=A0ACB7ITG2_PLECO|nr:hypothetical protein CCMSSC00406_0006621 [Pleurotus cornucopiae]
MTITLPSARVLGIPELLAHIFSLSTRQANAVHARVCKEWSDAALDVLWRKVTNVAHLMRLLSPLEAEYDEDGDVTWFFANEGGDITTSNWARLKSYARREVRTLVVEHSASTLHESVFEEIENGNSDLLDFLPNLQRLEWYIDPYYYHLFTDKKVTHLTMRLDPRDALHKCVFEIIRDIPKFLPHLESLTLQLPSHYEHISNDLLETQLSEVETLDDIYDAIVTSLRSLLLLSHVSLPKCFLVSKVVQQLSTLNKLTSTETSLPLSPCEATFPLALAANSFISMTRLTFSMTFARATECFAQSNHPPNIVHLELVSTIIEPERDYSRLLVVLSVSYPSLEVLVLDFKQRREVDVDLTVQTTITFRSLRPILCCTKLKTLILRHYFPFILEHDDILSIAKALHSIETLLLNESPHALLKPTFPIGTLLVFRTHCPRLKRLGLYFGMGTKHIPITVPEGCLSKISSLKLGASRADPCFDVGCFLNDVCPKAFLSSSSYRSGKYRGLGSRITKEWNTVVEEREIWRLADIYSEEQMKTNNLAHVVPPRLRLEILKGNFYKQEKEKIAREKELFREQIYQETMAWDGALHEADEEGG